ncbi:MAG: acetate--CoA ligase [Bacteroidota bacterium]|nr:acetate--CoA ligase [Bacteroidota bacterium]
MNAINSFSDYQSEYKKSVENPELFWADKAEKFTWKKKWDKVLDWNFIDLNIKWFDGGQLNITENCLDRHLATKGDQIAIIFEPNNVDEAATTFTYKQLHEQVCKFANVLLANGAKKGDRICIYLPMVPEAAIAMLACARIGAIHSVVFGGFSANALSDRINDASANILITSDGSFRGNKQIGLKEIADEALKTTSSIKTTIVLKRTGQPVQMKSGVDVWWHEEIAKVNAINTAAVVNSEDMLFILYTSGSTGKPKGVVHTTAGYMLFSEYTFSTIFQYREKEIYWCTADVGWITGHSYIVYGPLLAGATTLMFEGVPTYPDAGRFWQVIEKHKVNIFYTAPTAIRSLMAMGDEIPEKYPMNSLRVLGSVGEPINEEAWHWYHDKIGKKRCAIADTYWQTETGGFLISPIAGITPTKPAFATLPVPGIQPVLVDNEGKILEGNGVEGNLCIKFPWPSAIRTTYGDHERCKQTYFSTYKGLYFTGDGARRDEEGYYRILGRVDDVINVSGHRIGTAEVENAINEHPYVVESAVVGYPHDIKGQGIWAYVICDKEFENPETVRKEILHEVTRVIGPIAKPDKIQFVKGLPKTRSGKIMRRILRKVAEGDVSDLGDISTLLDPTVVEDIKSGAALIR